MIFAGVRPVLPERVEAQTVWPKRPEVLRMPRHDTRGGGGGGNLPPSTCSSAPDQRGRRILKQFWLHCGRLLAPFSSLRVRCSKGASPPRQGTPKEVDGRRVEDVGFNLARSLFVPLGSHFLLSAHSVGFHQRRHTRGGGTAALLRRRSLTKIGV